MLLTSATQPPDEDRQWAFEVKYDGYRAVLHEGHDGVRLRSRHGTDLTVHFPELALVPAELAGRRLVLDGELVVLDERGRPRFDWLQSRARRAHGIDSAAARRPATFIAFDLLKDDGNELYGQPYVSRRARLEVLALAGPGYVTAGVEIGGGADLLAASRLHQLEGIVAKRLDSPYRPGTRSRQWLKIKNSVMSELAIGGWRCDRHTAVVDTLLVGEPVAGGGLRFRGAVELGLHGSLLEALHATTAEAREQPEPVPWPGTRPLR